MVYTNAALDKHYSLTAMTTLSHPTLTTIADLRDTSNTQWDFALFLMYCLHHSYLSTGDVLVLDNAAVHVGTNSFPLVKTLLDAADVKLCFLLCYSPELDAQQNMFSTL